MRTTLALVHQQPDHAARALRAHDAPRRPDRSRRGRPRPPARARGTAGVAAAAVARRRAQPGPRAWIARRRQGRPRPSDDSEGERHVFFMMAPSRYAASRPSRMPTTRSATARTFGSWVTMTSPRDSDFARSRNSSSTCVPADGVEVRRRLVGQEHGRRSGERARDGDALLLSAREVAGQEVRGGRRGRRGSSAAAASSCARPAPHALDVQRVLDVLERGQGGEEVVLLEHEADGAPAHVAQLRRAAPGPRARPRPSISPEVGVRMQPMIESSVVLPEPDGPSSATTSPGATVDATRRAAPRRAASPPRTSSRRRFDGQDRLAHGRLLQARNTSAGSMPATRRKESMAAPRHISTVPTKTATREARATRARSGRAWPSAAAWPAR